MFDNPPCTPSTLLYGFCELFKSKIQNVAEAATIVQRSELGLCVFQIQQIGKEAKPRQIATGKVTQLKSQMLQRPITVILDESFPALPMTPPISCDQHHQCVPLKQCNFNATQEGTSPEKTFQSCKLKKESKNTLSIQETPKREGVCHGPELFNMKQVFSFHGPQIQARTM